MCETVAFIVIFMYNGVGDDTCFLTLIRCIWVLQAENEFTLHYCPFFMFGGGKIRTLHYLESTHRIKPLTSASIAFKIRFCANHLTTKPQ